MLQAGFTIHVSLLPLAPPGRIAWASSPWFTNSAGRSVKSDLLLATAISLQIRWTAIYVCVCMHEEFQILRAWHHHLRYGLTRLLTLCL